MLFLTVSSTVVSLNSNPDPEDRMLHGEAGPKGPRATQRRMAGDNYHWQNAEFVAAEHFSFGLQATRHAGGIAANKRIAGHGRAAREIIRLPD